MAAVRMLKGVVAEQPAVPTVHVGAAMNVAHPRSSAYVLRSASPFMFVFILKRPTGYILVIDLAPSVSGSKPGRPSSPKKSAR